MNENTKKLCHGAVFTAAASFVDLDEFKKWGLCDHSKGLCVTDYNETETFGLWSGQRQDLCLWIRPEVTPAVLKHCPYLDIRPLEADVKQLVRVK